VKPGQVFRFSYLWGHEAERGEVSGRKIRRVCLILKHAEHLYLFPLTSKEPLSQAGAARTYLRVPPSECLRLGLPAGSVSYLVLDDFNKVHVTQLYDFASLEPVGRLSPAFLSQAATIFLAAVRSRRVGGRERN
jgi:hypothetical protein